VRPEDLVVATDGSPGFVHFETEISERLGDVTVLYSVAQPSGKQLIAKLPGIVHVERGSKLSLTAAPEKVHLFQDGTSLLYL
jgi:alpha-glucoside transport system ATP-binding protein